MATRAQHLATEAALRQSRSERARAEDAVGQVANVNARLAAAEAALHSAELDLEYTRVRAPFSGRVVNLNISPGAFARSGTEVFTLVDSSTWYVMANFRETQLRHIPRGVRRSLSPVAIRTALPGHGRRARLGCAARERNERQWIAARRALARLDPARGALSRAYQGRGPRRIVPHRGLGGATVHGSPRSVNR